MLSSIHPLGERAKHNSFRVTAAAFLAGSVVGGAVTGALAGIVGAALGTVTDLPGSGPAAVVVAAVALGAAVAEWRGLALPSLHRQVDERWLDTYRNWVYGLGYGLQLGAGVTTYITTAAVYVVLAAGVLVGDVRASILIGLIFGLVRGLSLVPARRVHSTDRLVALFRTLERTAPAVRRASTVVLGVTGALAAAVVLA